MGLLTLANGHFELPSRLTLSPSATLADFEAAFGKGLFQPRWKDNYAGLEEHFLSNSIQIVKETYLFTFFFKFGQLISTHFHVESSEPIITPPDEEATYAYYRAWLEREVGEQRTFDWGFCDLRFDPKSQFGYIELSYLQ